MSFSENIARLSPSATIAVSSRARELRAEGRDIVNLGAGEPDFRTPEYIAEAAVNAIREGHTRYTPAAGLPELREAIAGVLEGTSGKPIDPARVVVTSGAKQALFNACFSLFGPGDRVLLPVPFWTSYPEIIQLARAEPVPVKGRAERGFKLDVDALDAAYDSRVRGLILNSPNNPTGAVYSRGELEAVVQWAAERDLWVLSDEIYARVCYTVPRAPGLLDLDNELLDRAVVIDGASKIFAMTGWRIGFACAPVVLAAQMSALQSHTTSNASTPAQYAALAAFAGEPLESAPIQEMIRTFHARRNHVMELFDSALPSLPYVRPEGAFYLFFRADEHYDSEDDDAPGSVRFCQRLLEDAGVALVPGAAFGDDRYVRLSFAASEDEIEEGVRRIAAALPTRTPVQHSAS